MDRSDAPARLSPLFLIGAPRSGTSLLYKALCLHPQAAWISNWVRRFPAAPQLALLNQVPALVPSISRRVWFGGDSNAYVYSSRRSLLRRVAPMPVEGEPLYEHCGVFDDAYTSATDEQRRCLRSNFGAITRWSRARVLVSKRIANNRRIGLLHDAFPAAHFVSLVRDGRAVASSLARVDWWEGSRVWWYGGTPKQWADAGGEPWELCARTWSEEVDAIEVGLDALPGTSVLRLSYEEFVADPLPALRRIADFAGLDPESREWSRRLEPLRFPDMNEGWRRRLDAATVATIEQHQRPQLRRYGYLGG